MADLFWDDVESLFDPGLMGALPDVVVPGTSVEDWQAALDLVEGSGWTCRYSEGGAELPVPRAEAVLSRPADAAEEIDFDVDLRELQGQDRLDVLCGFLTAIGRRLGKPVVMYGEGGAPGHPLLGFDVERDRVELLAAPLGAAETGAEEGRGQPGRPQPPAQPG
ncbi:hypothetical protein ABZ649_03260 [Streptomyces albidoflavus]|uniref:hypothetical protein n=1 Tax=Streptomyces albidoflavus TaxID=1886 RepID=UPI0033F2953F